MLSRSILCLIFVALASEAVAADIDGAYLRGPQVYEAPPPPAAWSWTGFYLGANAGGGAAVANFSDPFGPSIYGDAVTAPTFLAGGRIAFDWQAPNSPLVLGIAAELDWLHADGTNTCLAFSGFFVSANCETRPNMTADLTARLGWAYGYAGHSLLYVKGGGALVREQLSVTTNATASFVGLAPQTTSTAYNALGWTVGAGLEHAITPAWSVLVEYAYVGLDSKAIATPQGLVQGFPPLPLYFLTAADVTHVSSGLQEAKLGLNYKFGVDPAGQWAAPVAVFPVKAPAGIFSGWDIEAGARYFGSGGKFQKDLGDTTDPAQSSMLVSRLTYNATANSGEFFSRVEAPRNIFLQGYVGAGSISGGRLNDEDWVIGGGTVPYSNTISSPVAGNIGYGTADLGYDVFRNDPGYRFGPFVGYSFYRENESAYGCTQIANPFSDCVPAIPNSVLVITEDDLWQSMRVGLSGAYMITDRLKLQADAAYLPYVKFDGTDNHVLRALITQESGIGTGLQLDGVLSYAVNDEFSVGVGARYWSMWTTAQTIAEVTGTPCPCQTLPAKTELYGVFAQASYQFGDALFQ